MKMCITFPPISKLLWTITIVTLCIFPEQVTSKRILVVEFLGTKSHVLTYLPLVEKLAETNEVTLVSPLKTKVKDSIRQLSTLDMDDFVKAADINLYEMREKNIEINPFYFLKNVAPTGCAEIYDRLDIQGLMKETFDLVIVQPMFNDCALGFVYKITSKNNAPLILFSVTSAPSVIVNMVGGHHPPSSVASMLLPLRDEMSFLERMQNFGTEVLLLTMFNYYYLPTMEAIYREKLGEDMPSVKAILANASIVLSNGHFSISRPKPNYPDVIEIGGIHSHPPKPLSKDLEQFVSGSGDNGFILFSFGTGLRGDKMPAKQRQIFLNVFAKLKQRIIWKYEGESLPDLPKNVKLSKWLPQQDLLGHAKIKMFITHCGLGGIEESIFHGVPLLGIPFFGDQPLNAKQAENHGYLLQLDWNDLTEENLLGSINTVLINPKYRKNVKHLSSIFRDNINEPMDRALWWIEYVIRYKGAPHLQSASRKLNFFQFHSLDVIATCLLLLLSVVYVVYKVFSAICRTCLGSGNIKNKYKPE